MAYEGTMPAKKATTKSKGFSKDEREAIREAMRDKKGETDGEGPLLAAIAKMPPEERALAERIHKIVLANAPGIEMRTWYGFPAYAKDGDVIAFFKPAAKFKERYCTLGFNQHAKLDEGGMGPTSYAVTKLTAADDAKIAAMVKKAVGA